MGHTTPNKGDLADDQVDIFVGNGCDTSQH